MAASIILLPLMIDVVQMTIFRRPVVVSSSASPSRTEKLTLFLFSDEAQRRDLSECYPSDEDHEDRLAIATPREKGPRLHSFVLAFLMFIERLAADMLDRVIEAMPSLRASAR